MSIISSYFSTPPSNGRHPAVVDSCLAIAAGLGLRFIIDIVTRQNNKVTGTLVGLWEGVVLQHFLRKTPKSYDPYVAYGVRIFIDFLIIESLSRMALVLLWTGMGIVLADIAPAIWVETGLRRFWRRFRRDLYIIERSMPKLPLFPRERIVRFSPSRAGSVLSTLPPTVLTTTTTPPDPLHLGAPTLVLRKRPVPGAFPDTVSETDTDNSLRSPGSESSAHGTTHFRFSLFPSRRAAVKTASESSSFNDLDEGNVSSSESSQTIGTSAENPADIPDEEDLDRARPVDKGKRREEYDESTPIQNHSNLPPTPSDSAYNRLEVIPPTAQVPNIPDLEENWENISRTEAMPAPEGPQGDKRPTPPPKDVSPTSSGSTPPQYVPPPVQHQEPVTVMPSASTDSNFGSALPKAEPPGESSLLGGLDFSVFGDLKDISQFNTNNNAASSGGAGLFDDTMTGGTGNDFQFQDNTAQQEKVTGGSVEEGQSQPSAVQQESNPVHSPDPPIERLQSLDVGRLEQVLEFKKRATDVHNQIRRLTAEETELSAESAEKLGKLSRDLVRLNKKADFWHEAGTFQMHLMPGMLSDFWHELQPMQDRLWHPLRLT